MKTEILYLTHRIPYPPNKGDKIRSFHILKYLAERYTVHLGTFVDDAHDWKYVDKVKKYCGETCFIDLNQARAKVKSVTGLFSGQPLTVSFYKSQKMVQWIQKITEHNQITATLVFSSVMAQYINMSSMKYGRVVVDFVDLDSEKWLQFSQSKQGLWKYIYSREAKLLRGFEKNVATHSDAVVLVTQEEANDFHSLANLPRKKVFAISNGVDLDYFSSAHTYTNPYDKVGRVLVFTGAMDYWANVDAVTWFAHSVFKKLIQVIPNLTFFIVGAKPTAQVTGLAAICGITITGGVDDVRPFLAHADLAVVPMRLGRGIQNKVIEAMAMGKPVIASHLGAEGIGDKEDRILELAGDGSEWVEKVQTLLTNQSRKESLGADARRYVEKHFTWKRNLNVLQSLLDGKAEPLETGQNAST